MMKVKLIALLMFLTISTIGITEVFAVQSMKFEPQLAQDRPPALVEEATNSLTLTSDITDLKEQKYCETDSNFNEVGFYNITYRLNKQLDSTDFSEIQIYLKQIFPVITKMGTREIEMIEIL